MSNRNHNQPHRPPQWPTRFLRWFCSEELLPEIEGDLYELYQRWVERYGVRMARWLYILNALTFLRPSAIRRSENKSYSSTNNIAMLSNYFKIAFRTLRKNKAFSLINILGLAMGMAACLLILQYVRFETSYDQFHAKADRIYRVQHNRYTEGELQYQKAQSFIPTGEVMASEYAEVIDYTTLFPISAEADIIMTYQPETGEAVRFAEEEVYHVKGNFFDVFSFPIITGSQDIQRLAPNTAFISASTAQKYFGDASPIGKILRHNYSEDTEVVGVFADPPANAHFKPDFLFAWQPVGEQDQQNWRWDGFYTYLLLAPGASAKALEAKFPELIAKYGIDNNNASSQFALQPLTDIHLHSHLLGEIEPNGDATTVYTLLTVALFILLIAWINYVNLSTARSLDRAKEIGVRKAIGSGKSAIVKQFLTESLIINLLAVGVALAVVQLVYSTFSDFAGMSAPLTFSGKPTFWALMLLLLFGGSFVAGLYPAWMMASFEPISALKGKYGTPTKQSFFTLRHSLVIFQFAISIFLITASLIVYAQLSFMKTQSLGINIDRTLVVDTQITQGPPGSDSLFMRSLSVLKDQLAAYSTIEGVTASHDIPGKEHRSNLPNFRHAINGEEFVSLYFTRIDYDFIPEFEVDLLAGRNFKQGIDDQYAIIMNVEAIKELGFEAPQDAIGYEVQWGSQQNPAKAEIVGIVNFRSTSFKQKNYPIAYTSTFFPLKYLSVKFNQLDGENAKESIALVQAAWKEVFLQVPFEYFFLDDFFNHQYQEEQKFSQLLAGFTLLAIMVACLGLYAIASLTVVRRTKEVGVRKVLGASAKNLLLLLSKKFVWLVLVASVIALPIIWFAMTRWLEDYPYRTEITWWMLVLPIAATLMVTALTIGYQIIRVSVANPVESLRNE